MDDPHGQDRAGEARLVAAVTRPTFADLRILMPTPARQDRPRRAGHRQVLDRELHADFGLGRFRHHAFFNETVTRVEMRLVRLEAQVVHAAGERMQT